MSSNASFSSTFKPILLEQAQRHQNRVATSLLKIEKECGLVKYHGFRQYLQQRMQSNLPSTTSADTTANTDAATLQTNTDTANKKKIAFMITASMKQELTDNLGYSVDDIKRMTPLQASLVLNHQVAPADYDEKLPILEQEHEAEQEELRRQEAEKAERQRLEQEAQQEKELQSRLRQQRAREESQATFDTTSSSFSTEDLANSIGVESGFDETWYEVVEIKPNGDNIRQGLYPNQAEADLGLETREMIRDRQMEKDRERLREEIDESDYSTYEIREISRATVMKQQS
jgi:hypothetical protein